MTREEHANSAADSLEFQCELPDPPEKVWRALTEPKLLAAWLMPNDIEPEIGSRFAFAGPDARIDCKILDAEPGRLLRYSWRELPTTRGAARPEPLGSPMDSIVTFTLDRTVSGGTHLRIVHDGFARAATPAIALPSVTMASSGCRLSLGAHNPNLPVAANTPRFLLRAA
ncbi:SRPBCC domain-containing protein [Mesorhizobium sp. YC-39]|uniref:SRPBCC family protein n=1 Tax=unclassified Mesorhizobium TaxID=325217 RepID=UPI0021E6D76C|nr:MULTISPECIES: SRPBCC domain-containing protein [unclassified Mesorhizobium]MCV3208461.1 SRPBCC domain-containing protein [Mesorhizobium sp. YC-2]MCV3232190.1 SRPBCC domain-containing protein [Mesorhizobium sp. YC-39]